MDEVVAIVGPDKKAIHEQRMQRFRSLKRFLRNNS